jgi:hypothetical protein
MTSMQHNKGSASLDSSKGRATVQVSAAMALKAESAIATVALRQVEKSEGGKEGSMMNESLVVLAQFSLTRAEIGSFRQLKTSTREKDYCTCLFEQPQEVEGEDEDEEEDSSEISATSGACETTLHQPIPRSARSTPTTTTSTALPVWPATNTTACLTYPDSPQSQGSAMTTFGISSTSLSSQSPTRPPRHQRRRSSSFSTSEKQQSQQLRRRRFSPSRRPITVWLCLACGGPALELSQRWIKRISYSASTRLLRITICDSAFSSHEVRTPYQQDRVDRNYSRKKKEGKKGKRKREDKLDDGIGFTKGESKKKTKGKGRGGRPILGSFGIWPFTVHTRTSFLCFYSCC